jgi:MOSC domain-containing protein YiiM
MATDTRAWARVLYEGDEIRGEERLHLDQDSVISALKEAEISFIKRWGLVESIVLRGVDGVRSQPIQAEMTVEGGLSGDRWSAGRAIPGEQISMMNLDVAAAFANGQSIALFGDNLFTRLDLREEALPVGSRIQAGGAVLEVSATPHMPCRLFRERFGAAAFEQASKVPRLRGCYLTVIEGGSIALGDPIVPL